MGLNSNPNIIGLLTGGTEAEFEDGSEEPEKKLINSVYREQGYITFQMEDGAGVPNFENVKFKNSPSDIDFLPFFQAINQARDMRCGLIGGWGYFQYLQEKTLHKYQFDVIQDFLEKYKATPTFAFLHLQEYTHNDQNLARLYDDDLSAMLERLFDSGSLDQTFLLLMGDHGFRFDWGGTDQGKTETSMSALAVLPPQQFRSQHPEKYQEQNFIMK